MLKKIILISSILLLTIFTSVVAQNCKFKTNQKDPITGKKVLTTENLVRYNGIYYSIKFNSHNDKYSFELHFTRFGKDNVVLKKGTISYLKLGNDSIIELLTNKEIVPIYQAGSHVTSEYIITYDISREEMELILENGLSFIRAVLSESITENIEIKSKKGEKIKQSVSCILKN